jgi:uncharacterized integral membrane protein
MGTNTMKTIKKIADFQNILIALYLYLIFSGAIPIFPSFLNLKIQLQGLIFFALLFVVTGLLIMNTIAYSRLRASKFKS